jgi:hypothetical protein
MSDVTGAFKAEVSQDRQKEILDKLSKRPGVRAARLIKEDANSSDLRLLFYVRVDDDDAASVVEDLRKHTEIEVAQFEPRRKLT